MENPIKIDDLGVDSIDPFQKSPAVPLSLRMNVHVLP